MAEYLAHRLPCQRFAPDLAADTHDSAHVVRSAFIVGTCTLSFSAGLPRTRVKLVSCNDLAENFSAAARIPTLNSGECPLLIRAFGDTWADTTTSHGRLMLTVLGGLAEFERDLIRTRTGEGRARAVARGQKMGRPPKLTPHQQREAIKRRDRGEELLTEIGRSYNVSAATISRLTP